MGTPVTETLAPVIGWININASSKLLYLPLRCFNSLFTAFLDCVASHNLISEELVNRIGIVTPMKVDPMPVWVADQSVIKSDQSVSLPIRFTPYHICDIVFCIVPTLTHGILLGMEWLSSSSLVVNWTSCIVTLTIDGESLELKCVDVSTNLRLPHCIFIMNKRVNKIIISQSV